MIEEDFIGYDDTVLHAYVFEITKPKGVVQFVHGMQEYSKPYFDFAKLLNKKGYNVYMVDQRAHGKSCKKLSEVGKVNGDIFSQSTSDQICINAMLHHRYNVPIFLIGHSYGSFILQNALPKLKYAKKVILIGTGYMKKPKIYLAKLFSKSILKFKKPNDFALFFEQKIFHKFNKHFTTSSWVTSDEESQKFLSNDKLSRVPFSYGFYESLFSNLPKLYKNLNQASKNLEILILGGNDDPIGDYGKSPIKLYKVYKKFDLSAKIVMYANARHNLLFEKNKKEVYEDILNFLAK